LSVSLDLKLIDAGFTSAENVSCPKCDHKPFTNDVCKPNKAMRNTVKAYLKTIDKAKNENEAKVLTGEQSVEQPGETSGVMPEVAQPNEPVPASIEEEIPAEQAQLVESQPDDIQPSIEVRKDRCNFAFEPILT
jgi:hypothetical protein